VYFTASVANILLGSENEGSLEHKDDNSIKEYINKEVSLNES
jgi:hypothetical protein